MERKNKFLQPGAVIPSEPKERALFVRKAMKDGNKDAIEMATAILRKFPDDIVLDWANAVDSAIDALNMDTTAAEQLLRSDANRERRELLGGRDPSTVPYAERLLIERVLACQLSLASAERAMRGSHTFEKAEYLQRNIDRRHKQYLSAIETLAWVQRLALLMVPVALPGSVQVNIAR